MSRARDIGNAASALNAVTAAELTYMDGVTSNVQTQLDAKLASATAASTYAPSSTAVTLTGSQTLTNKILTVPRETMYIDAVSTWGAGSGIWAVVGGTLYFTSNQSIKIYYL